MGKLTYDFVKEFFEKEGCTLLESEYSNNCTPMKYRCSCGNKSTISFANFKRGSRCRECGLRKSKKKKRHTLKYVQGCFAEGGCELLESEYHNNYTPLKYKCSCGNVSHIRFFCFMKGQRCDLCDGGRGETHYNWNPDREEVKLNLRFRKRQGFLVKSVLNSLGKSKKYKSEEHLGYSTEELKNHIMSHPNWPHVKDGCWHIDHIFPIKAFLDHAIDDVKVINCLENLQPLSAKENLSKNDSYDREAFQSWLQGVCCSCRKYEKRRQRDEAGFRNLFCQLP